METDNCLYLIIEWFITLKPINDRCIKNVDCGLTGYFSIHKTTL